MNFFDIKMEKNFKDLLEKEGEIRVDFHGYLDFYNLIRGIAIDFRKTLNNDDKEKVSIIIKHIERNFGGINYDIDIDFNLNFEDINYNLQKIKNILKNYEFYNEKGKIKLNSVFLFKSIYNLVCQEKYLNNNIKIVY